MKKINPIYNTNVWDTVKRDNRDEVIRENYKIRKYIFGIKFCERNYRLNIDRKNKKIGLK